jgi:hypothetical protein
MDYNVCRPTFAHHLSCTRADLRCRASEVTWSRRTALYFGTISSRSIVLKLSLTLVSILQEMIADLKQDSLRWQVERDQIDSSRGYGGSSVRDPKMGRKPDKVLVDYTQSVTHQSRQYYGATGQQPPQMPPGVPVTQGGPGQPPFAMIQTILMRSHLQDTNRRAMPIPILLQAEPNMICKEENQGLKYTLMGRHKPEGSQPWYPWT